MANPATFGSSAEGSHAFGAPTTGAEFVPNLRIVTDIAKALPPTEETP